MKIDVNHRPSRWIDFKLFFRFVLILVALIPSTTAYLSLAVNNQITLNVSTADYLGIEEPKYNRTGVIYRPSFTDDCTLETPPQANLNQAVLKLGRRIDWTIAIVADPEIWQKGCQSYKQVGVASFLSDRI
jgi:hypothetical protein